MSILERLLLGNLRSASISKEEAGQMSIIILRPYDYLVTELLKVFNGQKDVKVKVDSRYGQRRIKKEPFPYERRQVDRRKTRETLVEVVIST